ncbi:MAG: TIGR03619 family F420-dependent LLM class oxidoreductase [Candidatus Dadabacteria bacterium]|nr:TIGR03619 family F420-dependent LLM class oxidoreductase [Candidatus Dadabacteria bacterium]NIQ14873.1 TIGR03619 family F420-dependent LLM class oxidoreductase [Candidatus Dadabacteria bacterium]
MKFGIALPNFGKFADKNKIETIAIKAEALGFDSLWVSDHIILPNDHQGFGKTFFEPLTTLSFIASKTKNISLGTSVIILPYRNPFILAKMISTLDTLSNGRIILGVGVGWLKKEFEALGIPFDERENISNENIKILIDLFSNDNHDFKGDYYKFSDISFFPKTSQRPHPPIWFGGNSNSSLTKAIEFGAGWHPVGLTPEEIKGKLIKNEIDKDFSISVRKNLQITKNKITDEKEILRGSIDKITEGIKNYKDVGLCHIVFQILSSDFKGILTTMDIISRTNLKDKV